MYRAINSFFILCVLLAPWGCKDPYVAPHVPPSGGYLVVEGYISGNTVTQFKLSRTVALPGNSGIPPVAGAVVQVEGSDNTVYPLTGQGNGIYSSVDTLALHPQISYRLRIKTTNGEEYLSDSVPFKFTPPIDSVSWVKGGNGVQIYVNTHDPANATHYYEWNYDQVYEYHSGEQSLYYYDTSTVPPSVAGRSQDQEIYRCWSSGSSQNLLVGSSTKLAQDVIYEEPLKLIPPDDVQLSVLYSILVRQYALTVDGYNFISLMQKNSEALGTVFDPQPTQLASNIHCLTHPNELVIGWVSAGTVQQQRIFISGAQVNSHYVYECPGPDTLVAPDVDSLKKYFGSGQFIPIYMSFRPVGWESNLTYCVDCRLQGGVNIKPSFWPF